MASESERSTGESPNGPSGEQESSRSDDGPAVFRHPQWMVAVVLMLGAMSIVAGMANPAWLLVGSPFILALGVYVWVRLWRGSRIRRG